MDISATVYVIHTPDEVGVVALACGRVVARFVERNNRSTYGHTFICKFVDVSVGDARIYVDALMRKVLA